MPLEHIPQHFTKINVLILEGTKIASLASMTKTNFPELIGVIPAAALKVVHGVYRLGQAIKILPTSEEVDEELYDW